MVGNMWHHDPRHLRQNSTMAEQRLWAVLRNGQMEGAKFRRQQPIGPYVVDGGQHADNPEDDRRTQWLSERGWRVIRFWNNEVLGNLEGVRTAIAAALTAPSP